MPAIENNEHEYIRQLQKRNKELSVRIEKAADIYRSLKKENKELKIKQEELSKKLEEYEEMVLLLY